MGARMRAHTCAHVCVLCRERDTAQPSPPVHSPMARVPSSSAMADSRPSPSDPSLRPVTQVRTNVSAATKYLDVMAAKHLDAVATKYLDVMAAKHLDVMAAKHLDA